MAVRERARPLKAAGAEGQPVASRAEAHSVGAAIMDETARAPDHVAHRDTPHDTRMVALRTFDYGAQQLHRGQIFRLSGLANDARLRDLRYFVELYRTAEYPQGYISPGAPIYECSVCGASFTDMGLRDGHARMPRAQGGHKEERFVPPTPPIREPGEHIDLYQNRLDEWAKSAGAMADAQDERRDKFENEVAPLDLTKTAASRA